MIDELDEIYQKEIEALDKLYLKKLADGKPGRDSVEKEYKKNLGEIRNNYQRKLTEFLGKRNKKEEKKEKNKDEKQNVYKADDSSFDLTFSEKMSLRWEFKKFKLKIVLGNFFDKTMPSFFIYEYLKTKKFIKRFRRAISSIFYEANIKMISVFNISMKFFEDMFRKIYMKSMEIFEKILKKISSKKKQEKQEKSKEDKDSEKKEEEKSDSSEK